jgi:hypothetical protein
MFDVGNSRVGTKSRLRILATDCVFQGKSGVWTDNMAYPEALKVTEWIKSIYFKVQWISYFFCQNIIYEYL